MVQSLDESVGRIMQKLTELGLEENTVVVFTSDNGGVATSEGFPTANVPLRAGKGWHYEGGSGGAPPLRSSETAGYVLAMYCLCAPRNSQVFLGAHRQQSRSDKPTGRHHGSVVIAGGQGPRFRNTRAGPFPQASVITAARTKQDFKCGIRDEITHQDRWPREKVCCAPDHRGYAHTRISRSAGFDAGYRPC
jgi:hypothetical protein